MKITNRLKVVVVYGLFFSQLLLLIGAQYALGKEAERPEEALKPVFNSYPVFRDDMGFKFLALAIRRNISYLSRLNPRKTFYYGPHQFTVKEVLQSQRAFLDLISQKLTADQLNAEIRRQFRIYRASGHAGDNKVLFTAYHDPLFDASLTPDDIFRYPLYRKPNDLFRLNLSLFDKKLKGESIVVKIRNNNVSPYFTRHQIDTDKVLQNQELEIAWLKDPIDIYLLHIEGSGRLRLPDGETISVSYQASNGRPYRSFGRYLLENGLLAPEELSVKNIRRYLSEHPKILRTVLNHNESYIFFQIVEQGPLGNINVPLTIGRSLALDAKLFPKGALAFISCSKPSVNSRGKVTGWTAFSRFVLNQDSGSAIKGAGRADLFFGRGSYAETAAWNLKHYGEMYVLMKAPEL